MRSHLLLSLLACSFCLCIVQLIAAASDLVVVDPVFVSNSNVLLVSTLDGSLHAVDRHDGHILWSTIEPPRLRVSSPQIGSRTFVTDAKDGGLYVIDESDGVRKFPKSIPELVNESPQKTSDGILITGRKTASWIAIDPSTGAKYDYQPDALSTCPLPSETTVFIPRTEYVLSFLDSTRNHVWNATYTKYGSSNNSRTSPRPKSDSDEMIITSSNSGDLMKVSADRSTVSWYQKYRSPVVSVYSMGYDGSLNEVSQQIVVPQMMEKLLGYADMPARNAELLLAEVVKSDMRASPAGSASKNSLERMLYVGQYGSILFALPTLFDPKIPKNALPAPVPELLLPVELRENVENFSAAGDHSSVVVPEQHDEEFVENKTETTAVIVSPEGQCISSEKGSSSDVSPSCYVASPDSYLNSILSMHLGLHPLPSSSNSVLPGSADQVTIPLTAVAERPAFLFNMTPLELAVLLGVIVVVTVMVVLSLSFITNRNKNMAMSYSDSSGSGSSGRSVTKNRSTIFDVNMFGVGKITFDPNELLGRGCDGTCVFRGTFDGRDVAVKRLLPDCFSFADREVALLRESDFHPNVIRYFCTEADSQFRYIALELCQGTLTDYVEHQSSRYSHLAARDLLRQAMSGLSHLHKLNIVHRDIKPHNVLLSQPDLDGHVRVLISDFGLCKKLQHERMSFSKVSGMLGTQGWIAPEMLEGLAHPTKAVDIFSAGCMFYYCLTEGRHPFGDNFSRQANIMTGQYNLSHLQESVHEDLIARHLISEMIQASPESRPSCDCVLSHPFFWNHTEQLDFLGRVSDQIDLKHDERDIGLVESDRRKAIQSLVGPLLAQNERTVVRDNWLNHICVELRNHLMFDKRRHYEGKKVDHLLRVIRNKRSHHHELRPGHPVRESLGELPEGFATYFTSRFPWLLLHTYLTIQKHKELLHAGKTYSSKTRWSDLTYPIPNWRNHNGTPHDNPRSPDSMRNYRIQKGFQVMGRNQAGDAGVPSPTESPKRLHRNIL